MKKYRRFLLADIFTSFNPDTELYQGPIVPGQQQHERDRIIKVLSDGQHVHVAIKKRIILLGKGKYLMGIMEISYSNILTGMWLEHITAFEGDIKGKTLLKCAKEQGLG